MAFEARLSWPGLLPDQRHQIESEPSLIHSCCSISVLAHLVAEAQWPQSDSQTGRQPSWTACTSGMPSSKDRQISYRRVRTSAWYLSAAPSDVHRCSACLAQSDKRLAGHAAVLKQRNRSLLQASASATSSAATGTIGSKGGANGGGKAECVSDQPFRWTSGHSAQRLT